MDRNEKPYLQILKKSNNNDVLQQWQRDNIHVQFKTTRRGKKGGWTAQLEQLQSPTVNEQENRVLK